LEIGAVFPQAEFPADAAAVRDWAQAAETLGYRHVMAYDHVLGADPNRPGGWNGPYTYQDPFFSPFLLFSYMAAVAPRLGYVTGVIILPQRQTALVAKQAATLDVLCGGLLRLGVGVGWNAVEYEALGESFRNRGRRQEEQVEVMKRLWTEPLVSYQGRWHQIMAAGINPMPVQRPIPIWFGGHAEATLQRMARLGDGWLPGYRTASQAQEALDRLYGFLETAGRSRKGFGLEPRLHYGDADKSRWRQTLDEWQAAGATHLSFNTMNAGLQGPQAHIDALREFAGVAGLDGG
jgi:probable F420-dependent oxidoreductase